MDSEGNCTGSGTTGRSISRYQSLCCVTVCALTEEFPHLFRTDHVSMAAGRWKTLNKSFVGFWFMLLGNVKVLDYSRRNEECYGEMSNILRRLHSYTVNCVNPGLSMVVWILRTFGGAGAVTALRQRHGSLLRIILTIGIIDLMLQDTLWFDKQTGVQIHKSNNRRLQPSWKAWHDHMYSHKLWKKHILEYTAVRKPEGL